MRGRASTGGVLGLPHEFLDRITILSVLIWQGGIEGGGLFVLAPATSRRTPPQSTAAPQQMSTPTLPRPERCGLLLFAPNPHTTALMMRPSAERIKPNIITAPTMRRSASMPGSPDELGSMSITVGGSCLEVRMDAQQVEPPKRKP